MSETRGLTPRIVRLRSRIIEMTGRLRRLWLTELTTATIAAMSMVDMVIHPPRVFVSLRHRIVKATAAAMSSPIELIAGLTAGSMAATMAGTDVQVAHTQIERKLSVIASALIAGRQVIGERSVRIVRTDRSQPTNLDPAARTVARRVTKPTIVGAVVSHATRYMVRMKSVQL